jgi:hypothetical protein
MNASRREVVLVGFLGLLPVALAGPAQDPPARQGIQVVHDGVGCVVAGRHPRLEARVEPSPGAGRVRIHFRAGTSTDWYFVEMKAGGDRWVGLLPKPLPSLQRFHYYVEATGTRFEESRTVEYAPRVVGREGECEARALLAAVSPVGPTFVGAPAGAPPVPAGFAALNPVPVAAAGAGTAASGGGGLSTGAIAGIALGGAAAVGGVVAVAGGKSDSAPAASGANGGGVSAPGGGSLRAPQSLTLALSNNCSLTGGGSVVYAGDTVTIARGMCSWPTLVEAQAATAGQTASITVDGVPLQPVRYLVSFDATASLACAVADADWKATAGRHVASGVWTMPGTGMHTCELSVLP